MQHASWTGSPLRWIVLVFALTVIGCDSAPPGEVSAPPDPDSGSPSSGGSAPPDATPASPSETPPAPDANRGLPADTAPLTPDAGFDSRELACVARGARPRSREPSPAPQVPKDAILVVGNADNPTVNEIYLLELLKSQLLFDLVLLADDNELARDFDAALVIISQSVNAATLNDEWANERAPIVVLDDEVLPFMGMSGDRDAPTLRHTNGIEVVQPDHPILRSFPDPCNIQLADDDLPLSFWIPDRPEVVILRVKDCQALIFGYESGDALASVDGEDPRIARHRRFGFFVQGADIVDLPPDGNFLLRNTLLYAWSGSIDRF